MDFKTVEEAKAHIVELNDRITALTNEKDSLSQDKNNLTEENESLRKLNQQYFNKLSAQFQDQEDKKDNDEEEVPSCEEFALKHNIL